LYVSTIFRIVVIEHIIYEDLSDSEIDLHMSLTINARENDNNKLIDLANLQNSRAYSTAGNETVLLALKEMTTVDNSTLIDQRAVKTKMVEPNTNLMKTKMVEPNTNMGSIEMVESNTNQKVGFGLTYIKWKLNNM
jgi:hypothetical protein